jgi:hypothetical protein
VSNGFAVAHADDRRRSHDDIAVWRNEIIAFPFVRAATFYAWATAKPLLPTLRA